MQAVVHTQSFSTRTLWAGRIISALPVLFLLFSGIIKLLKPAPVVDSFIQLGYPEQLALTIGLLEVAVTLLYAIPRTSVLGAILVTGYLGGAIATHVRVGSDLFSLVFPLMLGALIWGGLLLRDDRLHALIPLRK